LDIVRKVERLDYEVQYWFQVEVGLAIARRIRELGVAIPVELRRVAKKKGFWVDSRRSNSRLRTAEKLPLKKIGNRALYLRITAFTMIGAAQEKDIDLLKELTQHEYRMIASAAAIRLIELKQDAGISILQSLVTSAIERGNAQPFGQAVRDAEIKKWGLGEFTY
jgi:hypothetical protein